jgi:hypothetical protein
LHPASPVRSAKFKDILDRLWKTYQKDHKDSKRPPKFLEDKARKIEQGQEGEKKEEGPKKKEKGDGPKIEMPKLDVKPKDMTDAVLDKTLKELGKAWSEVTSYAATGQAQYDTDAEIAEIEKALAPLKSEKKKRKEPKKATRSALIRLAGTLPKGSKERRAVLARVRRANYDERKLDQALDRLLPKHLEWAELDDVTHAQTTFVDAVSQIEEQSRRLWNQSPERHASPRTAFNKENPSDLLGQLVKVLKKYELVDAASRVKGIATVVQKAWDDRER